MKQDVNYYRFINSETGHTIFYRSFPLNEPALLEQLEATRRKLAYEKDLYLENIYYLRYTEKDLEE